MSEEKCFHELKLKDVASWLLPSLVANCPDRLPKYQQLPNSLLLPMLVQIPSLQRSAVWKQAQVELLWDSIMRGFPIGSFVVSKIISNQVSRTGKYGEEWKNVEVSHHLLDGQQRCNAICLGFIPFPEHGNSKDVSAILWLDLAPKGQINSTRDYWLRLTTTAHPWGFQRDDKATRLPISDIRDGLKNFGWLDANYDRLPGKEERPRPVEVYPAPKSASAPIPFSLLLNLVEKVDNKDQFWDKIKERLKDSKNYGWAEKAQEAIIQSSDGDLNRIFNGLKRCQNYTIIALQVSHDSIITSSISEDREFETSQTPIIKDISNVEHLFSRLNSKGTTLEGLELTYSMIKAYWPGIEKAIDKLNIKPMPPAHLAMLGARLALTEKKKLQSSLSVSDLRRIAVDVKKSEDKEKLESFFDLCEIENQYFDKVLKLVDLWLLYRGDIDCGLLYVLRTSLAVEAPDVYLLLMWWARESLIEYNWNVEQAASNTIEQRPKLIALATTLHWFSVDSAAAVGKLFIENKISALSSMENEFNGILNFYSGEENDSKIVLKVLSSKNLNKILTKPQNNDDLKNWRWWTEYINNSKFERNEILEREKGLVPFLNRLFEGNTGRGKARYLLLYAQRKYLARKFSDYDPSNSDLWEQDNRPWDFDHILPSAVLGYNQGTFREVCRQWAGTIGNLRAWPMEENRSRGDQQAFKTITGCDVENSFLTTNDISSFSMERDDVYDLKKSHTFVCAVRERLLKIYEEWQKFLPVKNLLSTCPITPMPGEYMTVNEIDHFYINQPHNN